MTELDPVPLTGAVLHEAQEHDAAELVVLQRCCWVSEAILNDTLEIPALHESLETVRGWIRAERVWVVRVEGRLVAAVRGRAEDERWEIGRLMVAPDLAGQGLGRWLLRYAEQQAPPHSTGIALFTGSGSERNLRIYRRAGYRLSARPPSTTGQHIRGAVYLTKPLDGR